MVRALAQVALQELRRRPISAVVSRPPDHATVLWFVEERYLPMRQGAWSPAYRTTNSYEIRHYIVERFGRIPLGKLGTFEIQVWLNDLATRYSQSVVRHCYVNIRSITHMAKWPARYFVPA